MVFCVPHIKETNNNLEKIFNLIKLNQLLLSYNNFIVTGDFILFNEVYVLMEASCKHPCIYCTAPTSVGTSPLDSFNIRVLVYESKEPSPNP